MMDFIEIFENARRKLDSEIFFNLLIPVTRSRPADNLYFQTWRCSSDGFASGS